MRTSTGSRSPWAIDPAALERLLDLGDAKLGHALCLQLMSDFQRLDNSLKGDDAKSVARAAHELKGLAATVGATRLADMAASFEKTAEALPASARDAIVGPIHAELSRVLDQLRTAAGGGARL